MSNSCLTFVLSIWGHYTKNLRQSSVRMPFNSHLVTLGIFFIRQTNFLQTFSSSATIGIVIKEPAVYMFWLIVGSSDLDQARSFAGSGELRLSPHGCTCLFWFVLQWNIYKWELIVLVESMHCQRVLKNPCSYCNCRILKPLLIAPAWLYWTLMHKSKPNSWGRNLILRKFNWANAKRKQFIARLHEFDG
jgi:hypothetical protein